jgi:ABC-type dipeptide/oligopeptide/nickel transport system permease subunit
VSTSVDKIDLGPGDAVPVEIAPVGAAQAVKARGYWELVWSRFRRDRLAVLSVGFIVFLLFSSFVLAPVFAHILGHGPNDIFADGVDPHSLAPVGPWTHISTAPYPGASGHFTTTLLPLGADGSLGRDLFLRLLYGAQTSLEVALLATAWSVGLGVIMGLMAGYFRGWVDTIVSRVTEITMAFPALLFIIALASTVGDSINNITFGGLIGPGVFTLFVVFSVFGWFYPARIIRAVVLSLREKEFIEAARMTGSSDWRIIRSHILPHLVAPITVYSTLSVAGFILGEAGLSFLGVGIKQPTASWGNLLGVAPDYYTVQPWLMVWPGLAVLITTLAFNLLGDGLRDAFDPRATH